MIDQLIETCQIHNRLDLYRLEAIALKVLNHIHPRFWAISSRMNRIIGAKSASF